MHWGGTKRKPGDGSSGAGHPETGPRGGFGVPRRSCCRRRVCVPTPPSAIKAHRKSRGHPDNPQEFAESHTYPGPPDPPHSPNSAPGAPTSRACRLQKHPRQIQCFFLFFLVFLFSFSFFSFFLLFCFVFIYPMVERRNPPQATHFTIENENAIASKLGGHPTPPASRKHG